MINAQTLCIWLLHIQNRNAILCVCVCTWMRKRDERLLLLSWKSVSHSINASLVLLLIWLSLVYISLNDRKNKICSENRWCYIIWICVSSWAPSIMLFTIICVYLQIGMVFICTWTCPAVSNHSFEDVFPFIFHCGAVMCDMWWSDIVHGNSFQSMNVVIVNYNKKMKSAFLFLSKYYSLSKSLGDTPFYPFLLSESRSSIAQEWDHIGMLVLISLFSIKE